jgi:hypothetical protein
MSLLTLSHTLKYFEDEVLRKLFEPKNECITAGLRKIQNE